MVRNYQMRGQLVPIATAGSQTAPVESDEVARQGLVMSMARWAWSNPEALVSRVSRQFVQFWELMPTRMATDDPIKRERFHQLDPRLEVQAPFSRSLRDWVSASSFGLELSLALLGIVMVMRLRWRSALLPMAVTLAYTAGYALFVAKLRYRIPVLPLLFLFTGAGLSTVHSVIRGVGGRQFAAFAKGPP
jgi:hypothetical protein